MALKQYQTRLVALSLLAASCVAQAQNADPTFDPSEADYPVVITRIEEALRLMPGVAISAHTGNSCAINYHGTNSISPRRT